MLKNKVILITGTSSGIGKVLLNYFKENNFIISINREKSQEPNLKEDNILNYNIDITDLNLVKNCINDLIQKSKTPDILILNAGINIYDNKEYFDVSKFKECFDINFYGSMNFVSVLSKLQISKRKIVFDNGLKVTIDLSNNNEICAYKSKTNAPFIDFAKHKFHKYQKYWEPIRPTNNTLIIKKNSFYILKSKEKICIPPNLAGEMIPYDTGIGDFRVHYAGFFDPGFGYKNGSYAVLEVKTNEVPFILEDGQSIARIKYEALNKESNVLYGKEINSNYQNQGLALSKHFV